MAKLFVANQVFHLGRLAIGDAARVELLLPIGPVPGGDDLVHQLGEHEGICPAGFLGGKALILQDVRTAQRIEQ